jgi:L-alanine-DL-glutamate epimerase-like enolase superfamily enzyme
MDALRMIILDLSWWGGVSEARRVAAIAEAWHVPVAFHDCSGPVVLAVSTHLAMNVRNCFIQEMVRVLLWLV